MEMFAKNKELSTTRVGYAAVICVLLAKQKDEFKTQGLSIAKKFHQINKAVQKQPHH